MKVCRTVRDLRAWTGEQAHSPLGFVPTMGALHEGHLSLIRQARRECPTVVASIYVNPTQFGESADLESYRRTWQTDRKQLQSLSVDAVFLPSDEEIYPDGFSTAVKPGSVARRWEEEYRPGHFEGVCTVVLKLLDIVQPQVAYFGEKDYQQLQVIRAMVRDFDLPVWIDSGQTIRDEDGLALSSRNDLLPPEDRRRAPRLAATLRHLAEIIRSGKDIDWALKEAVARLTDSGFRVEYLAFVDGATLEPIDAPREGARLIAAACLGEVRLIDNWPL